MSDETATENKHPATSKALARLHDLVRDNGIDPAKVSIGATDEAQYVVHAVLKLTPTWEIAEISDKQAGKGFVKKLRSQSEVSALKNAALPNRWLDEARGELKDLPGKGWGLDDSRITLTAYTNIYGVDETCHSCRGRGTTNCSYCHGRGHLTCPDCHGAGTSPQNHSDCQKCHGNREITCPHCKNGQATCSDCHHTGKTTRYFSQKFYVDTSFRMKDTQDLPSELIRCIDRSGIKKLANGHAHIKQNETIDSQATEIPYSATLPFAIATFSIEDQKQRALVLGYKAAILEMKPFLEPIIEQHRQDQTLDKLRLFTDAQKLAAQGKKADALIHLYPVGISKDVASNIWQQARRSLYIATRRLRWITLGVSTIVSALIIYGWYSYDWRAFLSSLYIPIVIWDFLLPLILFIGTAWVAGFIERRQLCKIFGVKSARSQLWRIDLLPVALAIAGVFALCILKGPISPEWYASSVVNHQIEERARDIDPPND